MEKILHLFNTSLCTQQDSHSSHLSKKHASLVPPTGKTQLAKTKQCYQRNQGLQNPFSPSLQEVSSHLDICKTPLPCLATHELNKRASADTPPFCLKLSNLPEVNVTEL